MNFYQNKKILVTGGTGMIGIPLVNKLIKKKAKVTVVSLDDKSRCPKGAKFVRKDLRDFNNCLKVCKNQDIIFHLAGIKGSPKMALEKPASFLYPTISFSLNMLEAARIAGVKNYLFTSSVGVYSPAKIFYEKDVWSTMPSKNDWYAGWAKRVCELQVEAYKKEYNFNNISIIRPANVYGPYDNFDPKNAMVIPSLIYKATRKSKTFEVWGDGSPIRDFVYSEDVADAMIQMIEKKINGPLNIGSGKGYTIKEIADNISKLASKVPKKIKWKKTKHQGDKKRILSMKDANLKGISATTSLEAGINKTVKWFIKNENRLDNNRYNVFKKKQS
jgi:GDP-L-fucose synthase